MLLSGTLIVGVGDTVASMVGQRIGRRRWPGSKKTLEGTVAALVATALTVEATLGLFGGGHSNHAALLLAAGLACVLEAVTEQAASPKRPETPVTAQ